MAINLTGSAIAADISFGLGLLSSFGQRVDVVGIFSGSGGGSAAPSGQSSSVINSILGTSNSTTAFGQKFADARPLRATVRETARTMKHPIETGAMVADHKIINPVEIDLPLIVGAQFYGSVFSQIRQAWINSEVLSVKTRVGVYQNMYIAHMPHEEDPDMFDAITIALHLEQALFIMPGTTQTQPNFQPAEDANGNTIQNGLQAAAAVGGKLLTTATSIASYASVARRFF